MYHVLKGPGRINQSVSHAYVWVLPKSGTVYLDFLFRVYEDLLQNVDKPLQAYEPGLEHASIHSFEKAQFFLTHGHCPAFLQSMHEESEMLAKWKELKYYTGGWEGPQEPKAILSAKIQARDSSFVNDQMKMVFVFRNPLDQLISYFRHQQSSSTDNHIYSAGKTIRNTSLEEFIFLEGALDSYIKNFFTFHMMARSFPELTLFVPYEEMMINPQACMQAMLEHLGISAIPGLIARAIQKTSLPEMKAYENSMNRSLGGDQKTREERHVRNGIAGTWQNFLTPELVARIEQRLISFGLSLKMFNLGDDIRQEYIDAIENANPPVLLSASAQSTVSRPIDTTGIKAKKEEEEEDTVSSNHTMNIGL